MFASSPSEIVPTMKCGTCFLLTGSLVESKIQKISRHLMSIAIGMVGRAVSSIGLPVNLFILFANLLIPRVRPSRVGRYLQVVRFAEGFIEK